MSSGTGAGVQAEGGWLALRRCTLHGCRNHGVALFGDAAGGPSASDPCVLWFYGRLPLHVYAMHVVLGLCACVSTEGSAQQGLVSTW